MSEHHDTASRGSQDALRHKLDHQTWNQWLDRDEGLRAEWHASKMTGDDFIRHNEGLIDKAIDESLDKQR